MAIDRLTALSEALMSGADASGALAGMKNQQALAERLSATPDPTGGSRSGYVSPLQNIGSTMQQLQGTRDMRRLGKEQTGLAKSVAQAQMADKMYRHETAANAASLAQSNLMSGRKADVDAATIAHQRDVAESRRQEGGTYNEPKQAWYIESNDPFTAIYRDDGMLVDAATMQPPEGQYTTVNPYSKSGRATAGKGSGEDDPMVKVGKPDLVYDIITSDLLGPATGILDLQQWVGRGGYDSPFSDKGTGVGVQSLHSKMADVGIDQVKSNLEGLGVNPTDKDLTVAFASIPGRFTQPQGWIDWVKDQYLPLLNKSINDARAAGTLDEEGAAAMYNKTVQGIEIAQQKLDGLDEAKAEAEGGAEQPKYNSKGWKLQQDRDSGDLAYVNPDNPNEFEEVP